MSEWIKTAKVGDKVQCIEAWNIIDGNPMPEALMDRLPRVGAIYTIYMIGSAPECIWIKVEEIPRIVDGRGWPRFDAAHFRPLQSRDSDISIFTDMLKTAPAPIEETV